VSNDPNLPKYIKKLEQWRREYERRLDRKPSRNSLENSSHYLIEFQYQKFDEIEVPGQYMKVRHDCFYCCGELFKVNWVTRIYFGYTAP